MCQFGKNADRGPSRVAVISPSPRRHHPSVPRLFLLLRKSDAPLLTFLVLIAVLSRSFMKNEITQSSKTIKGSLTIFTCHLGFLNLMTMFIKLE